VQFSSVQFSSVQFSSVQRVHKKLTMVDFHEGQRVRIVAGKYKKNGYGTYMGPYGKVKCCVKVDNDTVQQRNLWRTSIKAIKPPPPPPPTVVEDDEAILRSGRWDRYRNIYQRNNNTATTTNDSDNHDDLKASILKDLEDLMTEIETMKATTKALESKLTTMHHKFMNYSC
jgi:hypothetical protein